MTTQQSEPQQQQLAPQPVVLMMNQPVMDARMQYNLNRQSYLNRGAQFSNGCRCYMPHMVLLCTLGGMLLFIGISVVTIGLPAGILLLAIGGALLGLGIYIIRTAKKQFESLPPDHPDRAKYAPRNIFIATGLGQGPAVYTVPPMQNQIMTYPTTTGGQVYLMPLPGSDPGHPHLLVPAPAASAPQSVYVPENDPPPAYSDVVRNA